MADDVITVELQGSPDDQGDVRLDDFIEELKAVKKALKHTTRIVADGNENAVYHKIIDLTHNSPYQVRIQLVARKPQFARAPRDTVRKMSTSLRMMQHRHPRIPDDFDLAAVEAYKDIAKPLNKRLATVKIATDQNNKTVSIGKGFDQDVEKLLGRDQQERGSIVGVLENLYTHNNNRFAVFPVVGPSRVMCQFEADLRNKVFEAAGKFIRVDGLMVYKANAKFPHLIYVNKLEIIPEQSATKFSELRGLAPKALKGERSEDYVRRLRDANW
jgi:hypothetical protein